MSLLPDPLSLLASLVALPGPPGLEGAVRSYVSEQLTALGCLHETDAKGNLRAALPGFPLPRSPRIIVTAHLDEIALLVTAVLPDGSVLVQPLGGAFPWKWGEGPVTLFGRDELAIPGLLSFGSIHTISPASVIQHAREGRALTWDMATVKTGLSGDDLAERGVRPGSRVVIAPSRRTLTAIGNGALICSYFLDDRADLVSWLLALESLVGTDLPGAGDILFVASAAEEVGGEGALYLLQEIRPEICIALEIGPSTPDAPVTIDATPTVWVTDSYSTMAPTDLDLLEKAAESVDIGPLQWQAVTRGGSDASCAASHGLCARPVTLAFPAENSHGFEIMHRDAPETLARLLVAYLRQVAS